MRKDGFDRNKLLFSAVDIEGMEKREAVAGFDGR